jgi:adenosylmethionine-8-amino-7-oxononanoate aminotransferase
MIVDRIWHPYTRFSEMVEDSLPVITRAEGIYLYDEQGRRILDAISSWWACSLGHGNPDIVRAIQEQAGNLQHSILGNLSHSGALELAVELDRLTGGNRRVHFASDGASAIEAALKIALQYWDNLGVAGRHTFLSLSDPYHGDTLGAVSVGYMETFHRAFRPVLFRNHVMPAPDCSACGASTRCEGCPATCFEAAENAIMKHGSELAAVVVEPLCQGAAGMRMYGAEWLKRLAVLCRESQIPLIVDEIAMGFCKTGRMFAYEHSEIRPDIVCVGKALSAGALPISAAIVDESIYATFHDKERDCTFYHGHTFAGNPIAVAAALAALRIYSGSDLAARARTMERLHRERLASLRDFPYVADVRILGSIAAVEFQADARDARGSPLPHAIRNALFDRGILVRPLGSVVYLVPPLIMTDAEIESLDTALAEVVRHCAERD